jgi:hypothetical protein
VAQDKTSWLGPASGLGGSSPSDVLANVLPQSISSLNDQFRQLTQNIGYLVPASQAQAEALLANTEALGVSTAAHSSGGVTSTLSNIASTLTGGALSLSPILSGILSLFGGGSSAPAPLTPFYLPPTINFQAANTGPAGSQLPGADFGQTGNARAMSSAQAGPQITVQVQAMDSQSFMDHSHDIAQAVRDAMLNMNSINDVITDL